MKIENKNIFKILFFLAVPLPRHEDPNQGQITRPVQWKREILTTGPS